MADRVRLVPFYGQLDGSREPDWYIVNEGDGPPDKRTWCCGGSDYEDTLADCEAANNLTDLEWERFELLFWVPLDELDCGYDGLMYDEAVDLARRSSQLDQRGWDTFYELLRPTLNEEGRGPAPLEPETAFTNAQAIYADHARASDPT